MKTVNYWRKKYAEGYNISELMRKEINIDHNSKDIIEMSYDLQSGTYIDSMNSSEIKSFNNKYTSKLANIIKSLTETDSILEAGIGEATTFSGVIENLSLETDCYGFDLSWSRVAYADKWLKSKGITNYSLCTGDLLDIPFLENSIDVVFTSHAIEPNRGNEEAILKELFRVTSKYLILLEPAYELTSKENQERMDSHKYCKNIKKICEKLGFNIQKHELFEYSANVNNPTSITIIKKNNSSDNKGVLPFACPKYKTSLIRNNDSFFSEEGLCLYPIINNIPCLRKENSVLSTKYLEIKEKT